MSNGSIQGQTYLSLQGGELQGNVEMNGNKITGLGEATNDGDAVNFKVLKNNLKYNFYNQFQKISTIYPSKDTTTSITRAISPGLPFFILIEADGQQNGTLYTYFTKNNVAEYNILGGIEINNNTFQHNSVYLATMSGIQANKLIYVVPGPYITLGAGTTYQSFNFVSEGKNSITAHMRLESDQKTPVNIYALHSTL